MICAQYVAPGMMTPASDQTSSDEYNYEDDGNDEPVQEYKENSQTIVHFIFIFHKRNY